MTDADFESHTVRTDLEPRTVSALMNESARDVSPFGSSRTTLTARLRRGWRNAPPRTIDALPIDHRFQFWTLTSLTLLLAGAAYTVWLILD